MKYMYEKTQERLFDIFVIIMYTTFILLLFGITIIKPEYLTGLSNIVNIYVSLFLVYRFNRFRTNIVFTNMDRKIVFTAGLFILVSSSITKLVKIYLTKIKNNVDKKVKGDFDNNSLVKSQVSSK